MSELDKTPLRKEDLIGKIEDDWVRFEFIERERLLGVVEGLRDKLRLNVELSINEIVDEFFGVLK